MSTTYSTVLRLKKPGNADRGWDTPINANADALDLISPLSALFVSTAEYPSTSLGVRVAAGSFVSSTGTLVSYAGTSSFAVTTAATNYLYLTDAGVLTANTIGFPAGVAIIELATVVAGATTITSVADARIAYGSGGAARPFLPLSGGTLTAALTVSAGGITITAGGLTVTAGGITVSAGTSAFQAVTIAGLTTIADAQNVAVGTTTGTIIATTVTQRLGFWAATPIVQPSGAAQASLTDSTTGTAGTVVNDVGAAFSQTTLNNNFASVLNLLTAIRSALVAAGLMKGSA